MQTTATIAATAAVPKAVGQEGELFGETDQKNADSPATHPTVVSGLHRSRSPPLPGSIGGGVWLLSVIVIIHSCVMAGSPQHLADLRFLPMLPRFSTFRI